MEQITISLETELKFEIEETLATFGLTWTEFLKDVIRDYRPVTEEMREAMLECEEILKNPKEHKGFHSVEELFAHLEEECSEDEV